MTKMLQLCEGVAAVMRKRSEYYSWRTKRALGLFFCLMVAESELMTAMMMAAVTA